MTFEERRVHDLEAHIATLETALTATADSVTAIQVRGKGTVCMSEAKFKIMIIIMINMLLPVQQIVLHIQESFWHSRPWHLGPT